MTLANCKNLISFSVGALFFFVGVITVDAATYYVAPTGSNSNNGTAAGTPFLTIQRCIDIMVAGDTCTVADGTYSSNSAQVGMMNGNAGINGSPITLKSTNPRGAKILLPNNVGAGNYGLYIQRAYWTIDGFEIYGNVPSNASLNQVGIGIYAQGIVVRNSLIHDIATNSCSNSQNGNAGIYIDRNGPNATFDSNVLHTIGRRLNGESGCSTTIAGNDHGMYVDGVNTISITRNLFYDHTRGWPIHVYSYSGGTTSNLTIFNNVFADHATSTSIDGHVLIHTNVINASIKNNISYNSNGGMMRCYVGTSFVNVVIDYNLSSNGISVAPCLSGVSFGGNNTTNTSPGFLSAGSRDYRLAAGSAAIDRGVNVGLPFTGANPDKGAYEFSGQVSTLSPPLNLRVQ